MCYKKVQKYCFRIIDTLRRLDVNSVEEIPIIYQSIFMPQLKPKIRNLQEISNFSQSVCVL